MDKVIQYFRFRRQLFLYSFFKELKCYLNLSLYEACRPSKDMCSAHIFVATHIKGHLIAD
jgi:hypothetical protein